MIAAQFLFMPNRTDYPWYCDGACEGFYPATPERIDATSFGRCSIRCGRFETSRAHKRISNEALHIPRERDKKISPTRNSTALLGAVNLRHENDRVSERIPAYAPWWSVSQSGLSRLRSSSLIRSNLTPELNCLSKLRGDFTDQRLSFQANGHPTFKAAHKCKRCDPTTQNSPAMASNFSRIPPGSHPVEGAMIGSEVIIKNPTHARSQQPIRTIGWSI